MNKTYRESDVERNLSIARFRPLDVLVIGGTGAGKSSTLNALFGREVSEVGRGCDPQTMQIGEYSFSDGMRFWDTPGLGDGMENDRRFSKNLIDKLYETYTLDNQKYGFIDNVLVILDGSGRDMGTAYRILNDIIVPNFQQKRIWVAINQADMAMKGRHWDERNNKPDSALYDFLEEKADSVRARIKEGTGVSIRRPVYYSAERNYNVDRLMDMIIDNMPRERRELVA